ncbi:piezo-type mechanosensitive ion channel component isoform X4 [Eupeodes corollae]|uniref:piezo-type mechanosensitive ion channel component isoform X4 n=1 Tax=Eupeodes corollae TaxID=290404 RepID=UPI00249354B5|nr:piezo-type mechanosensitive ion channel component isoform X4 [Eupeodes corollae]
MAFSYGCLILQRGVLPLVLVLAALFRPVGISFVYLLMFFISPFIPVATAQNFKGSVTAYLIILIALSTILLLCHVALQVAIIGFDIQNVFGQCTFPEQLLRHIGFVDLKLEPLATIEWLLPEVAVFITSIVIYLVTKRISFESSAGQAENGEGMAIEDASTSLEGSLTQRAKKINRRIIKINFEPLVEMAPMFCLATIFFAAVLRPSVPGGFYFLFFLMSGSYWATFKSLQRGFAILIRFVMVVLVLHTIAVVSYQTPWMQGHIDNSTLVARLVGLEPLITSSCSKDIRLIFYDTWFKLDSFISPFSMLFSYYVLALTSKNLIERRSVTKPLSAFGTLENGTMNNRQLSINTRTTNASKKDSWSKSQRLNMSSQQNERSAEPTETTPLVRHKKIVRGIESSVEARKVENDIPMDSLDRGVEGENSPSLFDQICYGIVSVGGFIYQNSYIFTNILMMAWSIVYHSWLTFVFLLWANVLWMIPNQRKAMMRSSPFIVFYAEVLLIAQYIYGMNLTNDELPSSVNTTGINLQQIGLERPSENQVQPCIPLIVKTSFLLMFWVTLRQFFKEKNERKTHNTIADMVAPLQVSVSAATAADGGSMQDNKKTSKFLKKAGDIIKNLLVRLWIWLLILVIFLCAITGVKMTGFRICYMAMFLFFLLVFQSSSKAWVKVMYGFWLFLIFYAMSILTLIYTYQFDKFDEYWNDYLNISKTLQEDIGLKKYETKDLFLHLVSPTIIVILTVIQVHYFHKRFIAALQHQSLEVSQERIRSTSNNQEMSEPIEANGADKAKDSTGISMQKNRIQASIKVLILRFLSEFKSRTRNIAKNFKGVCWRFLELHLIKAVYISAFVCCVSEVCVLHIAFCALCIIGLISKSKVQIFISRIISLVVSIIILTKMIYQVQYISHEKYNVTCNLNETTPQNNAQWFGLQKANFNGGLMYLIKKYIIFMVMVTLHAVVTLRQSQMRTLQGETDQQPPKVLFPGINRSDAEKNLKGMIKYLFNYGFYKFGLECTLITLVSLITYRQDVVAVFYVVWLCAFLWFERSSCAKVWSVFQCFTATIIFIEYLLLVGLPPGLCSEYPWTQSPHSDALQKWAMLPGNLNYNHINKLIFDFIMLLFINRQKRVFATEKKYDNDNTYPGGTNKSVISDIENMGHVEFENPTRDFLSTIRNYLDIIKNAILCGFYWITLAVVFLAGTNISDLLAIGYLIGSFIFLWQGSDFYLRPIRIILKRWNILLVYNVINITVKTFLQIKDCLFPTIFQTDGCWFIHMLGIDCAEGGIEKTITITETEDSSSMCPSLKSHSYLVWDAVCFAFLILQLRIFKSHYFCHIINDTKANTILADRGAVIIEDLRQKQIEHRKQHEQEVLRKIKRKMEKIRATQQKMLRPIDKPTHFDAIRAGDYYMFDDMDEKFELDLIEDEVDFLEDQGKIDESEKKMTRRKNLFEVCKEITNNGKKPFTRQRSYASAPGSRIGIKGMEPDIPRSSVISDPLVYPDSCDGDDNERTEKPKSEKPKADQPSTSKDASVEEQTEPKKGTESDSPDATDKDSDEMDPPNPIIRLLEAFMVSVVIRLNRFSRNYRYVMKILAEEKKMLKESKAFDRYGSAGTVNVNDVSTPLANLKKQLLRYFSLANLKKLVLRNDDTIALKTQSNTEIHDTNTTTSTAALHQPLIEINDIELDTIDAHPRKESGSQGSLSRPLVRRSSGVPGIRVMPPSVEMGLDETGTLSDEWSYEKVDRAGEFTYEEDFATRDHHIIIEALISAWYAILSNTDLICYIVVFINQVINASIISLPLPLMVFLWGTLSLPRPTKTFWITLIAYTQLLVLIKCMCQLLLSNNISSPLPNQPLAAVNIIGISSNQHYANYDLLLLLVLFFHRFVLKSQGLWKSEYKGEVMQEHALILKEDAQSKNALADANEEQPSAATQTQVAEVAYEHNTQESNSLQNSAEYIAGISKLTKHKYLSSYRKFFINLIKKTRLPADVYALMFLCDFINFFVLLFGFTAFGSQQGEGGVQTYLVENKVPIPFLIMLLVQFILIVIDRALYLRKALVHKIVFHFFSVIGIHIWMFFVIPAVTERQFYSLAPPIIFYIIKCFYLLLSSFQIKCGYPKRILGNFLTKGFTLVNMISFKFYMQVPFLFELRTILDWVCTDTTMTLFDWLKMEDIFSEIYFIKCGRQMETDFPAMRAQKKAMISKITLGGTIILLIVVSIWGPLCLFALGNAVGQSNVPYEVSAFIRIGPYDPIYETSNRESIYPFNSSMFMNLTNAYKTSKPALTFLSNYDEGDIAAIILKSNSPSLWAIAPPDKDRLLDDLIKNKSLTCRFTYSFTRTPPNKGAIGTVSDEITYELDTNFSGRDAMIAMLQGTSTQSSTVILPNILPKFIKVHNSGDLNVVNQLMTGDKVTSAYRSLEIKLHTNNDSSKGVWWEIQESCDDSFYMNTLRLLPYSNCDSGVVMYTFNDKKFPSTFSFLTAGGIIGLYTTFVLLASRVLKSSIAGQSRRIMYEDLPYVDRVLQLCLDIYLVREALELALEEDLFAKLLFLYRSPETMIKWTRPKEDTNDDETDTESVRSRNSHRRMD